MARHGIFVNQAETNLSTPRVAESGIPFVIGASPIQNAATPSVVGVPVLCTTFEEFEAQFGYSEDWESYNLCEFAYSHFVLYGCQPAIFVNLLDPTKSTMKEDVTAQDITVTVNKATIDGGAIKNTIVVKAAGGSGAAYVEGTDYDVFYYNDTCLIELSATHASEAIVNVAYSKVKPSGVDASVVAANMDSIELCTSTVGVIPDLICAPGYSQVSSVAAIMATKAKSISGVFMAKAIIDIDTEAVTAYTGVYEYKNTNNLTDPNEIICWPMVKMGDKVYHFSTALAGVLATTDTNNSGIPYESPSNKTMKMDGMLLADGTVVRQTKAQADILNNYGVVTALNFLASGWVCWGNYTAAYPASTDVKDYFIPISRMFAWVGNSFVKTYWTKLDRPMTRLLVDSIVDSTNIWLSGLVGRSFLLGARVEAPEADNTVENLMSGIISLRIMLAPPPPMQEIDTTIQYDVNYLISAFSA